MLPGAVVGWDMSAALGLHGALGVPPVVIAELMPVIKAVMVAKLNEQMDHSHGGKTGYFTMLADDISGRPYKKAEHRRALLPLLNYRSEGSVEFKHQNISAVLKGLGED